MRPGSQSAITAWVLLSEYVILNNFHSIIGKSSKHLCGYSFIFLIRTKHIYSENLQRNVLYTIQTGTMSGPAYDLVVPGASADIPRNV